MSYSSPYSSSKPPRRWPWVLLVLLLAIIGGTAGVLYGLGQNPVDLLHRSTPTTQAVATTDAGSQVAAAPAEPTDAQAVPPTEVPATETPAGPTPTPSPTPDPSIAQSPRQAAEWFGERWAAADYSGMYDLLSEESQAAISRDDFVARYGGVATESGLTSVEMTVTGDGDDTGIVPVTVAMNSALVGPIEQQNEVATRSERKGWYVVWTPSLIYAGLEGNCVSFDGEEYGRGSILDRNGVELAYDGFVNQVGIIPAQFENERTEVAALSKLVGVPVATIKASYADADPSWFVPVKDLPDPIPPDILNAVSDLPGVAIREQTTRVYPFGPVAAHVTGYVSTITAEDIAADPGLVAGKVVGRAGIEAAADDLLAGRAGGSLSIVDCASRAVLSQIASRPGVPPQDLVLSIDIAFQQEVDAALGDVPGSAVVIDPQTGGIMALVSHPSFDPNLFVHGLSDADAKVVFDETRRPLINRATQQGYPTGSIFKVITFSAAMADLGYTGDTMIDCPQEWSIPDTDQVWRDWTYEYGMGAQGMMTMHDGLVNSCNTVFYELGYELDEKDNELLPAMAAAYGLGAPTGIPYLPETGGTLPTPDWKFENIGDYWATGDAVNLSIGQGYLNATPLQMANVFATIANGGDLLQPWIVEYTRGPDGAETRVGKRTVIRHIPLSDEQVAELQSALRDQTSNPYGAGSSKVFGDMAWPIAGKTGTAQNQATAEGKPHSWFAAFGPYGDVATIASVVMVESSGEGVSYAAPITRKIYDAWLYGASQLPPEGTPAPSG